MNPPAQAPAPSLPPAISSRPLEGEGYIYPSFPCETLQQSGQPRTTRPKLGCRSTRRQGPILPPDDTALMTANDIKNGNTSFSEPIWAAGTASKRADQVRQGLIRGLKRTRLQWPWIDAIDPERTGVSSRSALWGNKGPFTTRSALPLLRWRVSPAERLGALELHLARRGPRAASRSAGSPARLRERQAAGSSHS
jgi:hypothetical protein